MHEYRKLSKQFQIWNPTGILWRFFGNLSEIHQQYCEDSFGNSQPFLQVFFRYSSGIPREFFDNSLGILQNSSGIIWEFFRNSQGILREFSGNSQGILWEKGQGMLENQKPGKQRIIQILQEFFGNSLGGINLLPDLLLWSS